ncbi:MAG: aryl-sulfate sulfotransferase [Flavobacteriales bacterium]
MKVIVTVIFFLLHTTLLPAQTLGLTEYIPGNADGYVLFSPMMATETYLIDKCGEKVHSWNTSAYRPGLATYLLEDGSLVKTGVFNNANFDAGGSGGIIERYDWNGNLVWSYQLSDAEQCQHHDLQVMPNGHILAIVWDRYSQADAIANGKNTNYANNYLWSEKIVELQPEGINGASVVWEWKLWDHLVQDFNAALPHYGTVADHPELVDINFFPGPPASMDWIHFNSIDYNENLDQILVSSHTLCEVWIIDHSTTSAEAASHAGGNANKGGDLLYRWGNPQAYDRGNPSNKIFYGQHHATWIPEGFPNEGKILVFNNGLNRPGTYSSIDIIEPPVNATGQYAINWGNAYLPTALTWTYTAPTPSDFYSNNISGVYPLNDGSFMICSGTSGTFFEIDPLAQKMWEYVNPIIQGTIGTQGEVPTNNLVFRCNFYPSDYAAFTGRDLTAQGMIENNPLEPSLCSSVQNVYSVSNEVIQIYPNPFSTQFTIDTKGLGSFTYEVYDVYGKMITQGQNDRSVDLSEFSAGSYFVKVFSAEKMWVRCVVKD